MKKYILLPVWLILVFTACKKESKPVVNDDTYYVKASIQNGQETFDFENSGIGSALAMKIEVGTKVSLKIYGRDEAHQYGIGITYKEYESADPSNFMQTFVIINTQTNESWGNATGNFTISEETDDYLKGTFSFTAEDYSGNNGQTLQVNNGSFKVHKEY